MIKLLKRIVGWLESRFPPKILVTQEMVELFRKDVNRIDEVIMAWDDRITKCERYNADLQKSLGALKEGIVKGDIRPALTDAQKQRQDFIDGNFTRPTISRKELEAAAK